MIERYPRPVLPDMKAAASRQPCLWIRLRETGAEVSGDRNARLGQVNLPAPLQTGRDVFAEWQWDGQEVVVRNRCMRWVAPYAAIYLTQIESLRARSGQPA